MATILKLAIKNIYPDYQHNKNKNKNKNFLLPINGPVLIPDLIFPVYKIDREQS
jgi:hypothetical protein